MDEVEKHTPELNVFAQSIQFRHGDLASLNEVESDVAIDYYE